jgi:hypothetical protein
VKRFWFNPQWYKGMYNLSVKTNLCQNHYINYGQFKGFNPHPLINTKYIHINNYLNNKSKDMILDLIDAKLMDATNIMFSPHPLFDLNYYSKKNSLRFKDGHEALYHFENFGSKSGLYTSTLHKGFYDNGNFYLFDLDFLDMYFLYGEYLMHNDYSDKRFETDSEIANDLKSNSELYDFILPMILESSTDNSRK